MCLSPVTIRNPYYKERPLQYFEGSVVDLDSRFVSQREYIDVPCGRCADCKASKFLAIQQRVQMEALTSYVYFCTLTYNDAHLPQLEFVTESGHRELIFYSDLTDVSSMFKRLRNIDLFQGRDLRYIGVTEYGSARFRPHHHLLIFVAKKTIDEPWRCFQIEKELRINIRRFYGVNIGSRKNPVYESLFTYKVQKTYDGKYKSTFDLRLVRDTDRDITDLSSINTLESVAKSISYLMSYINKPGDFDFMIERGLESMYGLVDPVTYRRLRCILKNKVYYSKHLGFGFEDGAKVMPTLRCKSMTPRHHRATQIHGSLPPTFAEFEEQDPGLYGFYLDWCSKVDSYIYEFNTSHLWTQRDLRKFFWDNSDSQLGFRIARKYEPEFAKALLCRLDTYTQDIDIPLLPKVFDSAYMQSTVYKRIRGFIERGISQRLPYLAFEYVRDGKVQYVPLCKYYRRYCSTYADVERLYDSLGVVNLDDYIDRIQPDLEITNKRKRAQKNAFYKHESARVVDDSAKISHKHNDYNKILHIFVPSVSEIDSIYHGNKSRN